jgi:ribosome biogenesis GTPase
VKNVEATVVWGANNIFTVIDTAGREYPHCRLKGKVLESEERFHNPLAPGDRVVIGDEGSGEFQIVRRLERRNAVTRWNKKRERLQVIAANVDRMFLITSTQRPAYRPTFVDRVLAMAELEAITTDIVLNKVDLPIDEECRNHLAVLEAIGYRVFRTVASNSTDSRISELRRNEEGTTVLFGQSGVGKSSLINALVPDAGLVIGEVSDRYDRGRHTTTLARQIIVAHATRPIVFIDTPGVREYALEQYSVQEIAAGFREFQRYIPACRMPSCTHIHEPGCAVKDAVASGQISEIRHRSYQRIVRGEER